MRIALFGSVVLCVVAAPGLAALSQASPNTPVPVTYDKSQPAEGRWQGAFTLLKPEWDASELRLVRDPGHGAWAGVLDCRGGNILGSDLRSVVCEGMVVRFEIALWEGISFEGRVSDDGQTLSGTFRILKPSTPQEAQPFATTYRRVAILADPPVPIASADEVRQTVRGAVSWISRQAVPLTGGSGGVLFPGVEGASQTVTTSIYGGSAGVLIFLENAASILDDHATRDLCDRLARGLRDSRSVDANGNATWTKWSFGGPTGLYTGDAGVGQAFLVRAAIRGDAEALATAVEIGDALLRRARKDGDTISWDGEADVISGAAGTALFLLDLGDAAKAPRFTEAARATGRWLLGRAKQVPSTTKPERKLPTWVLRGFLSSQHMPNFSHGTAGVAYALARIGARTGDAALLQASKDGAEWLLEHGVSDGDGLKWIHCDKDRQPLYMAGWCHGPAGTGRLFLLLHAITGDARYREAAIRGARFVMDYAAAAERSAPSGKRPYVPPTLCCGVAGVVDFFCDLSRATHDPVHAAFAKKAGSYLVQVAIPDGDGRKWKNGLVDPEAPMGSRQTSACNVDLMLGASGEALALLRLLSLDQPVDPVRGLPDRAITIPLAAK